ncbi:MAG: phosphoglucosamine mutase [Deltaproteobacteria bacterium]|nr:phosphoglucosamine mutase [Deltaproteobacteria bacterium]
MERALFGTDGIRGLANHGDMSPEIAFRIGMAVTHLARGGTKGRPRIVIGKDTRLSGYLFETALASGVCAMGGEVRLSGPLPTPAIAHLTQSMRADAGVVISASHNPYQDNGIKIFGGDGFKLPDARELELEALVLGSTLDENRPTGAGIGWAERLDDAPGRYISFVKTAFPAARTLEGLKVVVDAAHGAAYRTAPLVFEELGATTYAMGVRPDGRNINHRCGALHPEACARKVLAKHADLGIALDGDADRLIVVDERGRIVDGDTLMALCATRMLKKRTLKKRTLATTVMSNLGLERALAAHGGKLLRTPVGDRYVVEAMRKRGLSLGGEQSGHLIFLDHSTTGDGLVAALRLLSILVDEERPLSELADKAMTRVPQVLISEQLSRKRPLSEMPRTLRAISDAETKLGRDGRVLVRWSGTEPKLRVMLEGPNLTRLNKMAGSIMDEARRDTKD